MGYTNEITHYKINFAMIHHHKYSLYEIENMYPFERDLYTIMIEDDYKRKQEEVRKNQ